MTADPGPLAPRDALIAAHRLTDYRQMTPELARQLLALRARWRDRYLIMLHDGILTARLASPPFTPAVILTASTAADLAARIEADHAQRSAAPQAGGHSG